MDDPKTKDKDERFDRNSFVGTGRGSNVTVFFTPVPGPSVAMGTKGLFGEANDDLLLHELIHAIRVMQGRDNPIPTDDHLYDNQEEWLAILITNIYMSEKDDWPLRAHHHDYTPMRMSSHDFLEIDQSLHMMMVLTGEMPSLFNNIARRAIARPQNPLTFTPGPPNAAGATPTMTAMGLQQLLLRREFNPIRLFNENRSYYTGKITKGATK
jgi:hypothetical protein